MNTNMDGNMSTNVNNIYNLAASDQHKNKDKINELNFKGIVIGGTYQHCFEDDSPLIAPPLKMDKRVTGITITNTNELELKLFLPKDDTTKIINLGKNWKWMATVPDGFLLSKSPFSARKKLICYYLKRHPLHWAADIQREKEIQICKNNNKYNHPYNYNYNSNNRRQNNDFNHNFLSSQLSSGGSSSLELNFGNFNKFPEFRAPSVTRNFEENSSKERERNGLRGSDRTNEEKERKAAEIRGRERGSFELESRNSYIKTSNNNIDIEYEKTGMIKITNMLDNDSGDDVEIEVEEGREVEVHYLDVDMDGQHSNFFDEYTETELETDSDNNIYSLTHQGRKNNRGRERGGESPKWEDNMDLLQGAVTVGPQTSTSLNITSTNVNYENLVNSNRNNKKYQNNNNKNFPKELEPTGSLGMICTVENVHTNINRSDNDVVDEEDLMLKCLLRGSNEDFNCPQVVSYVLEYLLGK